MEIVDLSHQDDKVLAELRAIRELLGFMVGTPGIHAVHAAAKIAGCSPAGARPWTEPDEYTMVLTRAEMFCTNCGPLDEPGVHTQQDCPRYGRCPRCHSADHDVREFVKVTETRGRMRCPDPWHDHDRAATRRPEPRST